MRPQRTLRASPPLGWRRAGSLSATLSPPAAVSTTLESFPPAFVVFFLVFLLMRYWKIPDSAGVTGLICDLWWKHEGWGPVFRETYLNPEHFSGQFL